MFGGTKIKGHVHDLLLGVLTRTGSCGHHTTIDHLVNVLQLKNFPGFSALSAPSATVSVAQLAGLDQPAEHQHWPPTAEIRWSLHEEGTRRTRVTRKRETNPDILMDRKRRLGLRNKWECVCAEEVGLKESKKEG